MNAASDSVGTMCGNERVGWGAARIDVPATLAWLVSGLVVLTRVGERYIVRVAFGFRSVRGTRGFLGAYKSLTCANDSRDLTLPDLARLIRANYNLVFED